MTRKRRRRSAPSGAIAAPLLSLLARRRGALSGALVGVLLSLSPRYASAYCVAAACDPERGQTCERDANLCVKGFPSLHWEESCISFAVQRDGSVRNAISGDELERAVRTAFDTWMDADCGGGRTPALRVESLGKVSCEAVEYNANAANANIFVFRENIWLDDAMSGDVLGLTTAHYEPATGRLLDVDVELNGTGGDVTFADPEDGADLLSIATHEAGHFLGLDHTRDVNAVMYPSYVPKGPALRKLGADDVSGVCAMYPPSTSSPSSSCRPLNGFSSLCGADQKLPAGCGFSPALPRRLAGWPALAAPLFTFARRRARSRRR